MKTLLKNAFTKTCQIGVTNRANFLKITGVAGLALSCLAQTCAIIFNPKIDKKEKSFLVPQELADGILNSSLFWLFTSKTSDLAKKFVINKKIIPASLENILKKYKPSGQNLLTAEKHFLNFLEQNGGISAKKTGLTILNGAGLIGMIAGSILSVNIITPLIRNRIAAKIQKNKIVFSDIKNRTLLYNKLKNLDYSKFNKTFVYTKNNVCSYNENMKI